MDADLVIGNDIWYWDDCQMQIGVTHYRNFSDKKSVITNHQDKIRILSACAVWNKLYKRTLITDNNLTFYEGKHLEDMPFTFSAVALSRKIVFQPFSFLFYRQRNSSIMNNKVNRVRNAMDMLDNFSGFQGWSHYSLWHAGSYSPGPDAVLERIAWLCRIAAWG